MSTDGFTDWCSNTAAVCGEIFLSLRVYLCPEFFSYFMAFVGYLHAMKHFQADAG